MSDYQARLLQRLRHRQAPASRKPYRAAYAGYNATAGGNVVTSQDGSVHLADSLSLEAIALDEAVQFVGGSFE